MDFDLEIYGFHNLNLQMSFLDRNVNSYLKDHWKKLMRKKKVRHLLLWVGDEGLEIYNTTTWEDDDDKNKTKEVLDALENYTKPQSNHILARYQLRCLKQGDIPLEEFVTKARLLVDDSRYQAAVRDEHLRDLNIWS